MALDRGPDLEADVLVVGAGPVGLTAALLLDRLGCSVVLVEQRDGPQRAPAAHVVNARTFEVWRQIGLDVDHIRSLAKDPADSGWVHWVTALGGEVIGSLPFERQGDDVLALTPTPLRNLSQHRLEPLLVDELARAGVPVDYSHAWVSSHHDDGRVRSSVRGPDGTSTVTSRWVLACDGASSPVRRSLGIEPVGPRRIQSFVMVHLAADLRALVRDRPGVLFWVCDPAAGGAFVAHDIDREWVYMHPFDPDVEDASAFTVERCEHLVRAAMADPDVRLEVSTISTWTMTAQVAERYREGPFFLVGDAAHRFPPTGGLGLNTGVQDAHNLAWKLAAVRAGDAGDELLDTYERERRPVARHNADVSLDNAMKLVEVPLALGLDDDLEVWRAAMTSRLADPDGRARVADAIANQATHFDMLGLQLGYRYDLGGPPAEGDADVDPVRTYTPSSAPGGRLPHGWVRRDGEVCSTLDLVPLGHHLLVTGPTCELAPGALGAAVGRVTVVRLGTDVEGAGEWWTDVIGLPDDGALLVRPDQHVAARWASAPPQVSLLPEVR